MRSRKGRRCINRCVWKGKNYPARFMQRGRRSKWMQRLVVLNLWKRLRCGKAQEKSYWKTSTNYLKTTEKNYQYWKLLKTTENYRKLLRTNEKTLKTTEELTQATQHYWKQLKLLKKDTQNYWTHIWQSKQWKWWGACANEETLSRESWEAKVQGN